MFIWWSVVDGKPNLRGYGGSVARGGPAVWVDRICALTDPETRLFDTPARCAQLLAHEMGHALTLRHVCRATAAAGDPDADLPVARERDTVLAPADGVLVRLDALAVGVAAWRLGAGRARKEDQVQAGAGVRMHAKPGAKVKAGEPLLTLFTDEPERFERARAALDGAYDIAPTDSRPDERALVLERIDPASLD